MTVADVADARQARLIQINDNATGKAVQAWRRGMTADFDISYTALAPQLVTLVTAAQLASARGADPAAVNYSRAYPDFTPDQNVTVPEAFTGVDGSGRDVEGLLYGAVTTAKQAVGAGLGAPRALETGAAYLAAAFKTAIADLARSADLTAATGKGFTHYVRVINPGACSRCAILAGSSSYKTAFKRHPSCRCTAAPIEGDRVGIPDGFHASPEDYFESLSPAEQERIFTKAGAEAVRSGADPISVVNARRGGTGIGYGGATRPRSGSRLVRTQIGTARDGSPIFGYVTGEGTTARGAFARQQVSAGAVLEKISATRYRTVKRARLMPETIVSLTDDIELRQTLLRDAGYLRRPIRDTSSNAWIREREQGIRDDRAIADAFYCSLGITL